MSTGLILLFANGIPFTLYAQSSDREQPLHIEADSVELREKDGFSTYRGNVKITQGSLIIIGDMITIFSPQNELKKIVITGSPASFRQLNDEQQEVKATGFEMIYQADKELMTMTKQASLLQHKNLFKSERILYDMAQDIVNAGSEDSTDSSERVTITLHPKKSDTTQPSPNP